MLPRGLSAGSGFAVRVVVEKLPEPASGLPVTCLVRGGHVASSIVEWSSLVPVEVRGAAPIPRAVALGILEPAERDRAYVGELDA